MILNKTKATVYVLILVITGYVAGAFIGIPFVDNELLRGDIGKAKIYNNSTDSDVNVVVDLLRSDSANRQEMIASYFLLSSRVNAADSLVTLTWQVTEGIDSLKQLNKTMEALAKKTKNAKALYEQLFIETDKVLAGGSSGDYEQLTNNAGHAFFIVDNEMAACADFISTLADYGIKTGNEKVLAVAGGWIEYGMEDAVLSGAENEAVWREIYATAKSQPTLARFVVKSFPTLNALLNKVQSGIAQTKGSLGKVTTSLSLVVGDLNKVLFIKATEASKLSMTKGSLGMTKGSLGMTKGSLGMTKGSLGMTKGSLGMTKGTLGNFSDALGRAQKASIGLKEQCFLMSFI